LIKLLISLYTIPIKAFVFALRGVYFNKVLKPLQVLLDAIANIFSAKSMGPALVK